jgi:hypothetical protein
MEKAAIFALLQAESVAKHKNVQFNKINSKTIFICLRVMSKI